MLHQPSDCVTQDILAKVKEFAPEAMLTIPWEFSWLCAADAARLLRLPLHLILHDDWPSTITNNREGAIGSIKRWFCRRTMRARLPPGSVSTLRQPGHGRYV